MLTLHQLVGRNALRFSALRGRKQGGRAIGPPEHDEACVAEAGSLNQDEYESLVDARDHAIAMREVAAGAMATIADADMDAYLAAPSPLAFWRTKRGLTQVDLAEAAGITRLDLDEIEHERQDADVVLLVRFARVLRVRVDDLIQG